MNQDDLNPDVLKHFNLLNEIGILDTLDKYKRIIKTQEELLNETAPEVFNKHTIEDLIDYITVKLLDKFIPSNLVFALRTGVHTDRMQTISYRNLKETECLIEIDTLKPYEDFFIQYPSTISFSLFEYKLNKPEATNRFLPLEPEILVPIMGLGGLHGVAIFGRKILDEDYSPTEVTFLDGLMRFASIALQNIINFNSASTDLKTQLYNHSFFMKRLEEETARVKRHGNSNFVLVLDLDHFKKVNDTYGHIAGDQILVKIADILKHAVRSEDIVARFGGEEFLILLLEANQTAAWAVAERIRKTVESTPVEYEGQTIHVTVSIGGCHITASRMLNPQMALSFADEALYVSKDTGRNKTTFYRPGLYFIGTQMLNGESQKEVLKE